MAAYPPQPSVSAGWRESGAIAGGFLVLLITTWLIWGALAEAAMALAEAA
jgi:hypothetical protein